MRDVSVLDNLSSADIRNVENVGIVSNPGARYDASVKAIIRVNTIPKTGDGLSFDVRSSYHRSGN